MTNLGLWQPYIDEAEMLSWYRLPSDLQCECQTYTPDGNELDALSDSSFRSVHASAVRYANNSVSNLPYHNATHFQIVDEKGMEALAAYERSSKKKIPILVKQMFSVALRMHDCHHPGSTLRVDAPQNQKLYRSDLGTGISTEWASSIAVNQFGKDHGLSTPSRLFQVMVVWASTYGGTTPKGKQLRIPSPDPNNLFGCIMRAADVWLPSDFMAWNKKSIAITLGEHPATGKPETYEAFLSDQLGFLGYALHAFARLDAVAKAPLTSQLGWQKTVVAHRNQMLRLQQGKDTSMANAIKAHLASYGVF